MAAVATMPSGPQDIPGSRVGTPPPPLDPSTWSGSPESPDEQLATPHTPGILDTFDTRLVGKRRLTYGFSNAAPSQDAASSPPPDAVESHRRRSSTPFMFELGEPTSADPLPPAVPETDTAPPTPTPSTGTMDKVRRRLERSKTSLRRLRNNSDATIDNADPSPPRFKALRRLRAQSLSSSSSSNAATPSGSSAQLSILGTDYFDETGVMPGRRGPGRVLQSAKDRMRRRSGSKAAQISPPFNVVLASAGLQGPSPPQPSDEIVWGTLSYRGSLSGPVEPVAIDHFGTMLPRELKVAVFRALLGMGSVGEGRWDGINGARRELVRLSRVSKEWQSLCFDGSLWQSADYGALASVLPAETMRTIMDNARPCVKDLKLEGMEALPGAALTGIERPRPIGMQFSSLTTLDLRGCHTISEPDIGSLLAMSPNLKRLNVKGSAVVSSATLFWIPQHVIALEELDVSRCRNVRFSDVEDFLLWSSPEQRTALTSLRVAGLQNAARSHLLYRLAQLPNLQTLDFGGCSWLITHDIQDFVNGLGDEPSQLRHLVLSSCSGLTVDSLELLVNRLPFMEKFEAANLDTVFYLDPPPTLSRLIRSMPQLRRLDLDSTGRYGGVDDRLLHELIPGAFPSSPLSESHLTHLRIGNAKFVSAGAMKKVIRELPNLHTFIANGTEADNSVMREFVARRPNGEICLVDCNRLTPDACVKLGQVTRPRRGWVGYDARPFSYTEIEKQNRTVLHTFWGWDRVVAPPTWREARDREPPTPEKIERRGSGNWWRTQDDLDMERGACTIM